MNTNHENQSNVQRNNSLGSTAFPSVPPDKIVGSKEEKIKKIEIEANTPLANAILSRLKNKKEQAAVNLGIGANEVETIPFDLSQLETEGVFLNIDCSGFSSLERQIEWKALGVELPVKGSVRLSPPRAGLLPDVYRRKFMRAASQAHRALNKFSFRFTLCETVWGTSDYKWVPWNAFENFEKEYLEACETLAAAKAEALANYDEILDSLSESFEILAEDSAKRLDATLEFSIDRQEFVQTVVAHALSMIPSQEMIRDGMTISMKPKVMVLGSEMKAEQQKAKLLSLETARLDAENQQVRLEINAKAQIEQLKVDDFANDQQREREVKERIRNMKIEAARDAASEAVSPIKEGFEQITVKIYEAAKEMTERLQNAEFVPGALAKRARQMCEWYSLMNFTGDDSLEEVLSRLQDAAGAEAKVRSSDEMRSALTDVLRATSLQSNRLLDEDRFSALEL